MDSTQRADLDRMLEAGEPVTQGVVPDLDDGDARLARLWSDLRSFTPGDQPIGLPSISAMVGQDAVHDVWPVMQTMERAYFGWQSNRREAERKKAEARAKKNSSRARRR